MVIERKNGEFFISKESYGYIEESYENIEPLQSELREKLKELNRVKYGSRRFCGINEKNHQKI